MSDSPKHVTVRLRVPPELRDKISASSEQYNRSMNADMVARLEQSFELSERQAVIEENHIHNTEFFARNIAMQEKLVHQIQENEEIQKRLIETQQRLIKLLGKSEDL